MAQLQGVVSKDYCFVARARDGDLTKAGAEQVRLDSGIGMDQYTLRSEPLGNGKARDSARTEGVFR